MGQVTVRPAVATEQGALEAVQWRASLNNPGDREALLANPDAIELPAKQIECGGVFVAEVAGSVVGFAAILPRDDGDSELSRRTGLLRTFPGQPAADFPRMPQRARPGRRPECTER